MSEPIDPFAEAMKRAPAPGPGEVYQWRDLSAPKRNAAGRATPVQANDGSNVEVTGLTLCRVDLGAVQADIRDVEVKSAAAIEAALESMVAAALELGGRDVQAGAIGTTGTGALIATVDEAGNLLIKPVDLFVKPAAPILESFEAP